MTRALFALTLIPLLLPVIYTPQQPRQAIEAGNKRFVALFNQGDASGVASLYTTDARVLPPNSAAIEGRENIEAFWQTMIKSGVKIVRLETRHVESGGDIAVEVGSYTLTVPTGGGDTMTDVGKYVVVWKRQGHDWKLAVDTFNTNLPADR